MKIELSKITPEYLGKLWQAVPPSEANSPEANGDVSLTEKMLTSV